MTVAAHQNQQSPPFFRSSHALASWLTRQSQENHTLVYVSTGFKTRYDYHKE